METKALTTIKEQLQKEQALLQAKAEMLHEELASVEKDMLRITAAIAALDGGKILTARGKSRKAKEAQSVKSLAPSKADVIKNIRSVLEHNGVVEVEALKALVEERITRAGFTRMGLTLRFKEALRDSQFVDTPAGVRLNEEMLATVDV
jgi:hypothetical protein